jgi:hypothetical protein
VKASAVFSIQSRATEVEPVFGRREDGKVPQCIVRPHSDGVIHFEGRLRASHHIAA